jgi:hypothetical protein
MEEAEVKVARRGFLGLQLILEPFLQILNKLSEKM